MSYRTSDLIVLDKMCERDKDIRMAKLPDNFVNCRRVKAGGHLTIGVDDACASILMNMALGAKDYGAALIIYKREHFDEIKTELKNGIPLPHLGDPCLCGKVTEGCTLDRETLYNRVIELQGKLLEAAKPKSTLNEMFPGEFSGALPGSIESKWAAEKNTLTPEQAKEFDTVVGKCGVHAPGTAITDWTCDLDRGHSGRHSNGRLGREHEWDDNGHLYYF